MFFSSNDSLVEELREAEAEMLKLAQGFGCRNKDEYEMKLIDTVIPRSSVPLKPNKEEGDELTIHGICITSKIHGEHSIKTPLVLQHGYMNASCFYYRNLAGLSKHFETIYSLDMLGWGLSSRPSFDLTDDSVETAQDFFVESLEAWRKAMEIDRMILAGHSMGGYCSVAYCEKYAQHVKRLVLLSPVGVPEETKEIKARRKSRLSLSRRLMFSMYSMLFDNPCTMIRTLPRFKGRQYMLAYVKNRLPAIINPQEQAAFAEYLYLNCILPSSGAHCLNRILNQYAYAKRPLLHRIPALKVANISFLYGSEDWMDHNAALDVYRLCQERKADGLVSPRIKVYIVRDSGHLLMLDNWEHFNTAVLSSCGGDRALSESASDMARPTELTSRLNKDGKPNSSEPSTQPAPQVIYY